MRRGWRMPGLIITIEIGGGVTGITALIDIIIGRGWSIPRRFMNTGHIGIIIETTTIPTAALTTTTGGGGERDQAVLEARDRGAGVRAGFL